MRTKVTLVLLFLNVALFFFIFKFERNWRIERASLEARRRVLGAEAADIRSLEVASTTAARSYRLERRGENWWLTQPLEWPANPPAVNRLVNELLFLEHVTSFAVADLAKNGQSLADYGLDKPKMKVTFHSGESPQGPTTTLLIGDTTKVGNQLYILSADGARVHVVGRGLADSLGLPLEQLRADTLLTIPVFEARSLKLQPAAPQGVAVYLRRDGSRWIFGTPLTARASKDSVELVINGLNSLRVKSFVAAAPGTLLPSSAPALRVTVEGNNRLESLLLGAPVGPAANGASETDYYAQFEDRSALRAALFTVTIPSALMDKLRDAQEKLRETHVLDFDSRLVSSIALSAPNQNSLVLQKLDTAAPSATATARIDSWQMTRRGESSPNTLATTADRSAVDRLLEQLTLLEAKKFLTESASANDLENWGFNRPEREISLTQGGPAPSTVVLQIGLSAERDGPAYARLGPSTNPGASIYVIDRKILAETPVAPFFWRERTLRELPATARITSLKLTDLSTRALLVDTAIDAAGLPEKAGRNAAALTTVLNQLKNLRAKRFTQENFGDRIATPLGEKTWRYELTYTLSLPGGAGSAQSISSTLLLTERFGGGEQVAGAKEFDAMFEIEQPFVDALWTLVYGGNEPAPPPVPDTAPPFLGTAMPAPSNPGVSPAIGRVPPSTTPMVVPTAAADAATPAPTLVSPLPGAGAPTPTPLASPVPARVVSPPPAPPVTPRSGN